MAISDLQLSLLAIGAAGVLGVFAYNKWQERKHRAHAERVFKSDHPDVLIERQHPTGHAPIEETPERIEPVFGEVPTDDPRSVAAIEDSAQAEPHLTEVDERIECLVRFEAAEPIPANEFWTAQRTAFELVDKPLRWFALDTERGVWCKLGAHAAGRHQRFRAALQLADRRGPLSSGELVSFCEGLQKLGDRFLAVVDYPQREQVVQRANEVDAFCAGVDAQIAAHVVAGSEPFAGAKLQALLEGAGLQLRGDGRYHAEDAAGNTLFSLGNLEAALFCAEQMASVRTRGVTVSLDVPRVGDGVASFDRMVALALRIAQTLGGELVDDNRARLTDAALLRIRQTVEQFQKQMTQQGIPAGSASALRLFD